MSTEAITYYHGEAAPSTEVTSSEDNAVLLDLIRRNDLTQLTIDNSGDYYNDTEDTFLVDDGDDLGWLAHHIGRNNSLTSLRILTDCLEDGMLREINHNRSIETLEIYDQLNFNINCLADFLTANKLKVLCLEGVGLGDDGVVALSSAQLKHLSILSLPSNRIGEDGCMALKPMLGSITTYLKVLDLSFNGINDEGLEVMVEGLLECGNLKTLDLSFNPFITAEGLRHLSTFLSSTICTLENLLIEDVDMGDYGVEALAVGLVDNKSLKKLVFDPNTSDITATGWSTFSRLLCDISSINSTHRSNHTLHIIGEDCEDLTAIPHDISYYLKMNKSNRQVARCKVLLNHRDLDVEAFFIYELKLLPAVVTWFRGAEDCSFQLLQSYREFGIRELSTYFKFVNGFPTLVADAQRDYMLLSSIVKKRKFEEEASIMKRAKHLQTT
jgi:hypothetical protein